MNIPGFLAEHALARSQYLYRSRGARRAKPTRPGIHPALPVGHHGPPCIAACMSSCGSSLACLSICEAELPRKLVRGRDRRRDRRRWLMPPGPGRFWSVLHRVGLRL
jgi:hypothetical protein